MMQGHKQTGHRLWARAALWAGLAILLATPTVLATDALTDLTGKLSIQLQAIYYALRGIITVVAVVCAGTALLIRMISRNQKAVDEATGWIKRIVIAWICFMMLGYFVAWGNDLVKDAQSIPWGDYSGEG